MDLRSNRVPQNVNDKTEEALHFSPFVPPEDIICEGSDAEQSPKTIEQKHRRYEYYASLYMRGKLPIIQSASLRGPLDKESGWTNPWRAQSKVIRAGKNGRRSKKDSKSLARVASLDSSRSLSHGDDQTFGDASVMNEKDVKEKAGSSNHQVPVNSRRLAVATIGRYRDDEEIDKTRHSIVIPDQYEESTCDLVGAEAPGSGQLGEAIKHISESYWLKGARNAKRPDWDFPPSSTPTPLPTAVETKHRHVPRKPSRYIKTGTLFPTSANMSEREEASSDQKGISSHSRRSNGRSLGGDFQTSSQESGFVSAEEFPCKSTVTIKQESSDIRDNSFIGFQPHLSPNSQTWQEASDSRENFDGNYLELPSNMESNETDTAASVTRRASTLDTDGSFVSLLAPSSGDVGSFRYKRRRREFLLSNNGDRVSLNDPNPVSLEPPTQPLEVERQPILRTLGSPFNSQTGRGDAGRQRSSKRPYSEVGESSSWDELEETLQGDAEIQSQEDGKQLPGLLGLRRDTMISTADTSNSPSSEVNYDVGPVALNTPDEMKQISAQHGGRHRDESKSSSGDSECENQPEVGKSTPPKGETQSPNHPNNTTSPRDHNTIPSLQKPQTQSPWAAVDVAPPPFIPREDQTRRQSPDERSCGNGEASYLEIEDRRGSDQDQPIDSQRSNRLTTPGNDDEIKPFSQFFTPILVSQQSKAGRLTDHTSFTQRLEHETTHNPWAENMKTPTRRNSTRRVSFGPLPKLDEDSEPEASGASKLTIKFIKSPPPPVSLLKSSLEADFPEDNASESRKFERHFRIASRHACADVSSSQRSPRVDAMAEAFILADTHMPQPDSHSPTVETDLPSSPPKRRRARLSTCGENTSQEERPPAEKLSAMSEVNVNALIGEMSDFLQEWDVEMEIKKAGKLSPSKDSSQSSLHRRLLSGY